MDWRPWGPEALAESRRENRPIFLSIGYSTCRWCHVMQDESFKNPAIAALLNRFFVPIQVDREERPDLDRIYMSAAEAAGWGGGWPLNLWLTPRLKPFFGAVYLPPESRGGMTGLKELLIRIEELWRTRRDDALRDAEDVGRALEAYTRVESRADPLDAAVFDAAFQSFRLAFDPDHGGFGAAPKFPMPAGLDFLLRYSARTGNKEALAMAARTLRAMADGGIHDQLGGGFHRYATDAGWRAPHFEKMLCDNAQLAAVYLDAFQATGDPGFARTARRTLDYLLRDMARPEGGFRTAEDADENFYLWRREEILKVLGAEGGARACAAFGIEAGASVLRAAATGARADADRDEARRSLLVARSRRKRPSQDDKILAGYNGLTIAALAKGARILDEPRYLQAAEKTARFLRDNLYDAKANRLYRSWRGGERRVPGFAEDYAFTIAGLLDLHETDFDPEWLAWATRLAQAQLALFHDAENGGFYSAAPGRDEELPARLMEDADGPLPSAGAVATMNCLRLAALAERGDFERAAEKTLLRFAVRMSGRPRDYPALLGALDFKLSKMKRISVYGDLAAPDSRALLREIRRRYLPNAVVTFASRKKPARATVCRGSACSLPTGDPAVLGRMLDGGDAGKK
ncbi:MAG: thioredoxin domain-containing protein [Elusimicrobia bacterium]|nr:thioredoxin domain-containing protein [Elusimicrobiota bacterium]